MTSWWQHISDSPFEAFMTLNGLFVLLIGAPILIIITLLAYRSRSK